MPIHVICPHCRARFTVSEKFSGKRGPCPKCKGVITIPSATQSVTLHEQEDDAPKDSKGRSVLKPIKREETKVNPIVAVAIGGVCLLVLLATFVLGRMELLHPAVVAIGLLAVSGPIVVAAYGVLRESELEPYRGGGLWLRAYLCGAACAATWGVLYFLPESVFASGYWSWLFILTPFFAVCGGVAMATLDLDFGSGAALYGFHLGVSLLLRFAAGYEAIWTLTAEN